MIATVAATIRAPKAGWIASRNSSPPNRRLGLKTKAAKAAFFVPDADAALLAAPGRAGGGVFEHDPRGVEFVANAIRFGVVPGHLCVCARGNHFFDAPHSPGC